MLGLSLDHWIGVAFDSDARACAEADRVTEVNQLFANAQKDGMGIDVIAGLLAMLNRGG